MSFTTGLKASAWHFFLPLINWSVANPTSKDSYPRPCGLEEKVLKPQKNLKRPETLTYLPYPQATTNSLKQMALPASSSTSLSIQLFRSVPNTRVSSSHQALPIPCDSTIPIATSHAIPMVPCSSHALPALGHGWPPLRAALSRVATLKAPRRSSSPPSPHDAPLSAQRPGTSPRREPGIPWEFLETAEETGSLMTGNVPKGSPEPSTHRSYNTHK